MTPYVKLDIFSKTFETNVKGTMLCVRAVSKAMESQEPLKYEGRHGTRDLGRGSIVKSRLSKLLLCSAGHDALYSLQACRHRHD